MATCQGSSPRASVANVALSFSDLKYFFECPYQFKLRILYGFNAPIHEALGYSSASSFTSPVSAESGQLSPQMAKRIRYSLTVLRAILQRVASCRLVSVLPRPGGRGFILRLTENCYLKSFINFEVSWKTVLEFLLAWRQVVVGSNADRNPPKFATKTFFSIGSGSDQ